MNTTVHHQQIHAACDGAGRPVAAGNKRTRRHSPPLVMGGQGRSARAVVGSGLVVAISVCASLAVVVGLIVTVFSNH